MGGIRVRFAPSPTGTLHVGGARTALFNFLYARSQGGVFVLRIEDTDQERSTEQSHQQILRAMRWMGLDWDEGPEMGGNYGPYIQSERRSIYDAAAAGLRESGQLYPCYCTADELESRREATGGTGYDGRCRDLDDAQRSAFEREERVPVWRLRMPNEGSIKWTDLVHGDSEFDCAVLDDWVAIKSDGYPTYNFACVVDDHAMEISHVLRGNDHVSNTPRQIQLYRALEARPPKFGHMPMILGADGKRLSKRHGAASVEDFRDKHVLPEAFLNYLALLGWSSGSNEEYFPLEHLIRKFTLRRLNKSAAIFDPEKFRHINAEHLKHKSTAEKAALLQPILEEAGYSGFQEHLPALIELMGNRLSDLDEAPAHLAPYLSDEYAPDPEGAAVLDSPAAAHLGKLAERFAALSEFDADGLEAALRTLAEELALKAGELIHPARYATTGQSAGPSVFDSLAALGRERVVARLRQPRRP